MFEKIFGKKNSIQRSLVKRVIVIIFVVALLSILEFRLFVGIDVEEKLASIKASDIIELSGIMRRTIGLIILDTILATVVVIGMAANKMMQPITSLNEATKKVAQGDFNVKLETKRNDEIGELTENFNKMVQDLSSIDHIQKDFIDNVSHEIKTPITSIEGFATLLEDENLTPEERKEYSGIIKEESGRLINLTSNMLKLSKVQNQSKITNKQQIDVAEQIRKAIDLLELRWSEKEIVFNVSLNEKYFYGDEELIFQVWVNLLDNAIKFSKEKGKIDVILGGDDNFIEVKIRDYGIGIKESDIDKMFTRFYQIDKSHSTEGYGLGLTIVKKIVTLSGGEIKVESKENEGTTMIVRLPIEEENSKILIK